MLITRRTCHDETCADTYYKLALGTGDLLAFASWAASAASHTLLPLIIISHLHTVPSAMPPNSPSSGAVVPPPGVFLSPLPSVFSSAEGAKVVGMRIGVTAHSAFKASGLSTSGARFCGWSGADERHLNGI